MVEGETGFPDAEKHGTVATGQEIGWGNWIEHGSAGWSEISWAHLCGGHAVLFRILSLTVGLLFTFAVPHGLLGPGPVANGFPPGGPGGPKGMQHFPPGPGGPMPGR